MPLQCRRTHPDGYGGTYGKHGSSRAQFRRRSSWRMYCHRIRDRSPKPSGLNKYLSRSTRRLQRLLIPARPVELNETCLLCGKIYQPQTLSQAAWMKNTPITKRRDVETNPGVTGGRYKYCCHKQCHHRKTMSETWEMSTAVDTRCNYGKR